MIYVASPYSSSSETERFQRYLQVREFCWLQMEQGKTLISPIVYGHQYARDFNAPTDAASWHTFNHELFLRCDEMYVLRLRGWEDSIGVQLEMRWADRAGKPITYFDPIMKESLR